MRRGWFGNGAADPAVPDRGSTVTGPERLGV
jgi:hypothetical protein